MRVASHLVRFAAASVMVLTAYSPAAAQPFTLTGRILEQVPGGGAITEPQVEIARVNSAGTFPQLVGFLLPCAGEETTDCIAASGAFNKTGLETGLYLIKAFIPEHMPGWQNVSVNGDTAMGDIGLIRTPYNLAITLADIPATGGAIPFTIRGTKTWASPTVPVVVRVGRSLETSNGFVEGLDVDTFDFIWPADLTDTGTVPLGTIDVSPADPAGSFQCVVVQVRLQSNPRLVLGIQNACKAKLP